MTRRLFTRGKYKLTSYVIDYLQEQDVDLYISLHPGTKHLPGKSVSRDPTLDLKIQNEVALN